jgi:uncharacterized ion transporter superfamily protein YfcC
VALFILIIGGFLGIVTKTGAIDAGIERVTTRLRGREEWMIPILMALFAAGGTIYGMAEESLPFYTLLVPVMLAARLIRWWRPPPCCSAPGSARSAPPSTRLPR